MRQRAPEAARRLRRVLPVGLATLGVALAIGGGRPIGLVVLRGGRMAAAAALRRAGLRPAVNRRGGSSALLLGRHGVAREAVAVAPSPSGIEALYVAPLRRSSGRTPAAESGPHRVIGGPALGVAGVADAGGYLALALGSGGQVSVVRIQRGLGPTVAVFGLAHPAASVALHTARARPDGVRVRWTGRSGLTRRAVLYRGSQGWRSTSARLRLQAAPVPRRNGFIFLVERVRATFGGRPVALAEDVWYHFTDWIRHHVYAMFHGLPTPAASFRATGGQPRTAATSPPATLTTARRTGSAAGPAAAMHLPADLPLPRAFPRAKGEGVWVPIGPRVGGKAVMARTFVLPDPTRPYARVDLVWMNTRLVRLHLVAGTAHPKAASGLRGAGVIPAVARGRLLAAFNGGFKKYAGRYGSFGYRAAGVWYRTPIKGLATLAVYGGGRVVLGPWGGRRLPASPAAHGLMQNLDLLIDHGRIASAIRQSGQWGITVGNSVRVWRSGLAQDAAGNLIYAAGTPVTAQTLARVFALTGARRAMQLDINSYWVTFNTYQPAAPGANTVVGTKLMPNMVRSADRYLTPDRRDFVYVTLARSPATGGAG